MLHAINTRSHTIAEKKGPDTFSLPPGLRASPVRCLMIPNLLTHPEDEALRRPSRLEELGKVALVELKPPPRKLFAQWL